MQGDPPADGAIFIEPVSVELLYVRGLPLSAFVHMKQRPIATRLFRADQKPALTLAFETDDEAVTARVRQALADSADVFVR